MDLPEPRNERYFGAYDGVPEHEVRRDSTRVHRNMPLDPYNVRASVAQIMCDWCDPAMSVGSRSAREGCDHGGQEHRLDAVVMDASDDKTHHDKKGHNRGSN